MDESDILIDIIIILMYVLLASTLAVSVWSAWNGVRTHQRRQSTRIGYGVAAFTVVLLVVTWLLGSTRPIVSNGQVFDNPWWLRLRSSSSSRSSVAKHHLDGRHLVHAAGVLPCHLVNGK